MEWFFAPVALALFHSNGLRRGLNFDPIKMQLKTADLLQPIASSNEHGIAL